MPDIGQVNSFAGALPTNYVQCNGQTLNSVSNPEYAALYEYLNTAGLIGAGTPSAFQVPNLSGRVTVATGTGDYTGPTPRSLGDKGGLETHTLTESELPAHNHTMAVHNTSGATSNPNGNYLGLEVGGTGIYNSASDGSSNLAPGAISNAGSGHAHNNMQPYFALNVGICYQITATTGNYRKISDLNEETSPDGDGKLISDSSGVTKFTLIGTVLKSMYEINTASVSSNAVTFDMKKLPQKTFKTTVNSTTGNITTLTTSNDGNETHLFWLLDITGTRIITLNTGSVLDEDTLPSECSYNSSNRQLTFTAGTNDKFNCSRVKDGSSYEWVIQKTN